MKMTFKLLGFFFLFALISNNVFGQKKYSFEFVFSEVYLLSNNNYKLPGGLDKNGFDFSTRDSTKAKAYYPFGTIEEYKSEFDALDVIAQHVPMWYYPDKDYIYLIFDIEKIKSGGYIIKLNENPVSEKIINKTGEIVYLPTKYSSKEECLKGLVQDLKKHYDTELYNHFISWKE